MRRRWQAAAGAALVSAVVALAALIPHAGPTLVVSRPLRGVDAIVSLASHEWERLPLAARRAADYPDAAVLLTLPQKVTVHNCHDCNHRVDRLRHLGVHPARVTVVPLHTGGTYGEALAIAAYARDAGYRRILVVTSPYHTRRSLATFEFAFRGTDAQIGVEPARATSPAVPSRWWQSPYDRAYVAYECAALLYYRLRYGVTVFGTE